MTSITKTITKFTQNPNVRKTYYTLCGMGGGLGAFGGMGLHSYAYRGGFNRMTIEQYNWHEKPIICAMRGVELISYISIGFVIGVYATSIIIPLLPILIPVSVPVILSTPSLRNEVNCIFGFK